jgi:hypothetical protein
MNEDGHLIVLAEFDTYQQADDQLDRWDDKYPNGCVDIWSRWQLNHAEVLAA